MKEVYTYQLSRIKEFDERSLEEKIKDIKNQIDKLKANLDLISSLKNMKGEKIMKPFINDENVIGKWKYLCSTESVEKFNLGETYQDKDILFKELYFLPSGQGYWVFESWSNGVIYHFRGNKYKYSIIDGKLFVEMTNSDNEYLHTMVYEKVDNIGFGVGLRVILGWL